MNQVVRDQHTARELTDELEYGDRDGPSGATAVYALAAVLLCAGAVVWLLL